MQERTVAYELWEKEKQGVVIGDSEPRKRLLPDTNTALLAGTPTILTDLEGAELDEEIRAHHHAFVKQHGGLRCVEVVYPFGLGPQR